MEFVNIYIEKYEPAKKDGVVRYTIDFKNDKDLARFQEAFGDEQQDNESNPKFYGLTMPYQGNKIMYEGSWYRFQLTDLKENNIDKIIVDPENEEEGGAFYWRKYKLEREVNSYSSLLTKIESLNYQNAEGNDLPSFKTFSKLHVIDCGQGNWNEVWSEENEIIIYDLGASSKYSVKQIKNLINGRFQHFNENSVVIYISHWDMDHFQALKYLSKNEFAKVKCVYGPSNIPNTRVYKAAIDNILNNNIPFHTIPNTTRRIGHQINLNLLSTSNYVDLYSAVSGRSRNQTGIVLAIKGEKKVALLTGDHHYCKILEAIQGKYNNRKAILVAPHHGGKAGTLDIPAWLLELDVKECAISVGVNSYGHPNEHLGNLTTLIGQKPRVTELHGHLFFSI